MREIKFRAWDKQNNVMWNWKDLESLSFQGIKKAPELTLMQYTGLKDNTIWSDLTKKEKDEWQKNNGINSWKGKEIYEGDIVKNKYDMLWFISFNEDKANYKYSSFYKPNLTREYNKKILHPYFNITKREIIREKLEVTGNIYENKDLIN